MVRYKFKFSELEIKHIVMALMALTLAFSFILFRTEIFSGNISDVVHSFPSYFLQSLVAVGIGFILHEMGHKFVAQKYGLWAEFRAWPAGLLLAVGLALFSRGGFVFAAPGAVMISPMQKTKYGYAIRMLKPEDGGKIAIVGSVINVMLAVIFAALSFATGFKIFQISAQVNAWLALFNQIPVSLLDGAKVFSWSKGIWFGFFMVCIALFGLTVLL